MFTPDSVDATDVSPTVAVTWVHGDYFPTFGIPLVSGRSFTAEEQLENRLTAIVSRRLADRYWPGEDAVGKRVRWGLAEVAPENPIWMTVIGIAGDVVDGPPGSEPIMHIYVPYSEVVDPLFAGAIVSGFYRAMTIAGPADGDEALVLRPVRNAITSLDPALAVTDIETMEQVAAAAAAPQRFSAVVLASFAGGGLLLAAIGLYGVLAFAVAAAYARNRRSPGARGESANRGEVGHATRDAPHRNRADRRRCGSARVGSHDARLALRHLRLRSLDIYRGARSAPERGARRVLHSGAPGHPHQSPRLVASRVAG